MNVADESMAVGPVEAATLVGRVLDQRYRIECALGRGGMGQVWRVTHLESLQQFALKTLHPHLAADPRVVARFNQEARAAGGLKSRHVVRIIDARANYIHDHVPMPFVVMELLEGDSLEAFLARSGHLAPGHTLWLAKQISLALDVIHAAGIVHRDLKPSNVFLAYDEDHQLVVKLCDFGLAKVGAALSPLTETGSGEILGTPLYMAPEQLRAVKRVGPAADLWAFALLIYRALSGEDYFGHCTNTADLIVAVLQEPLLAPSRRSATFPPALDRWFLKACALAPEQRFNSAKELYHHLEIALGKLEPESIHASHLLRADASTARTQPLPKPQAGQLSAASWFALTLVPVAVLGLFVMFTREPTPQSSSANPGPDATTSVHDVPSPRVVAIEPTGSTTETPKADVSPVTSPALESQAAPTGAAPVGVAVGRARETATALRAPTARVNGSGRPPPSPDAPRVAAPPHSSTALRPPSAPPKSTGEVCGRSSECRSGVCLASRCR